jgi:hypothetical protein
MEVRAMSRRQDLIKQYQMAYAAGDCHKMEKAGELILSELKTGRRTIVKLTEWADEYDRKRFGDQHLGPCAMCGHSMMYHQDGLAMCPSCGYTCDVARLNFWCDCSPQDAEDLQYYVGVGHIHGWRCKVCGGIRQTG